MSFKNYWATAIILKPLMLSGAFLLSSCTGTGTEGAGGDPGVEGSGSTSEFWIGVKKPDPDYPNAPRYKAYKTNWGTDPSDYIEKGNCVADPDGSVSEKDIWCQIHVDELDMVYHGATLVMNAPEVCEYVAWEPHWYWNMEAGVGPTATRVQIDGTGALNAASATGSLAGAAYANAAIGAASESRITGDNTVGCIYDYSYINGFPNCCTGEYVKTTCKEEDPDNNPGVYTCASADASWGGELSNCIKGPGARNNEAASTGFPVFWYEQIEENNEQYEYKIERERAEWITRFSFEMANYFSAADQRDTAAWDAVGAFAVPPDLTTSTATDHYGANNFFYGRPFYTALCLDRDDEILARIRVSIREWNTKDELTAFFADETVDPDQYDDFTDPDNQEDTPFGPAPYNDRRDFDDYVNDWGNDFGTWPSVIYRDIDALSALASPNSFVDSFRRKMSLFSLDDFVAPSVKKSAFANSKKRRSVTSMKPVSDKRSFRWRGYHPENISR